MLFSAALESERWLFKQVAIAPEDVPAKVLLCKRIVVPTATQSPPALEPILSAELWDQYRAERCQIEKAYGLDHAAVNHMVERMRLRAEQLPISWYFLRLKAQWPAAVGLLRFTFQGQALGRLQDVDVFPRFRGQGIGNQLLAAIEAHVAAHGLPYLFVGADEDDWPLAWYERHGYVRLGRVQEVQDG